MYSYSQKNIAIIGGTSGLGLALANNLLVNYNCAKILVTGRHKPRIGIEDPRFEYKQSDLTSEQDWRFLYSFDVVIYCAGLGRVDHFDEFSTNEIMSNVYVNAVSPLLLLNSLSQKLKSDQEFRIGVVTSIASQLVSPLFSVYSATKSCISRYIQSVNIELEKSGSYNIITEIAPGYISGTGFYEKETSLELLEEISTIILASIAKRENFTIPEKSEFYSGVIKEYQTDPVNFGKLSYDYKLKTIKGRTK